MKNVVTQLNQIQAAAHAFYIAFHDYHWNVKGIRFMPMHEYTEKIYNEMSEIFDDVAERAIQIGGKALTGMDEIAKAGANAPRITCESYTALQVAEQAKAAYDYLLAEFKKLDEVASAAGDSTTANIAQDYCKDFEKKIWMLRATLEQ